MSARKFYTQQKYIMAIDDLARKQGVHIEVCTDFEEFQKLRRAQSDRPPLGAAFDAGCSYIGPANGFWVKGVDANGQVVHTQAMRLLDLSKATLADHLQQHRLIYQPPSIEQCDVKSFEFLKNATGMTGGKVVYHGELWMRPGLKKHRGGGLVAVLTRFMLAMAYMQWSPDYVFGFMLPIIAYKGLAMREGYTHVEPGMWKSVDDKNLFEEWIVWMRGEEIDHLMRFPPQNLYNTLKAPSVLRG
jgi:hypothetical protein